MRHELPPSNCRRELAGLVRVIVRVLLCRDSPCFMGPVPRSETGRFVCGLSVSTDRSSPLEFINTRGSTHKILTFRVISLK